jgi:hypothetical protein
MEPKCPGHGCDHVLCIEHKRVLEKLAAERQAREQAERDRASMTQTLTLANDTTEQALRRMEQAEQERNAVADETLRVVGKLVQAEQERDREIEISRNDPAEQRAERYLLEARDLTLRLIAAEQERDRLREVVRRAVAGLTTGACYTCGAEPGCNIDCAGCLWVSDAIAALAPQDGQP